MSVGITLRTAPSTSVNIINSMMSSKSYHSTKEQNRSTKDTPRNWLQCKHHWPARLKGCYISKYWFKKNGRWFNIHSNLCFKSWGWQTFSILIGSWLSVCTTERLQRTGSTLVSLTKRTRTALISGSLELIWGVLFAMSLLVLDIRWAEVTNAKQHPCEWVAATEYTAASTTLQVNRTSHWEKG